MVEKNLEHSPPPRPRSHMLRREAERVDADAAREGRECFGGCQSR